MKADDEQEKDSSRLGSDQVCGKSQARMQKSRSSPSQRTAPVDHLSASGAI